MANAISFAPMSAAFSTESEEPSTGMRATPAVQARVVEYLPLVRQLALRMHRKLPPNVQLDDLIAAGSVGLIDAVRRFDGVFDEKFEWYARVRIRGAMVDELRRLDWLSRRQRAALRVDTESGSRCPVVVVGFDDLPEQQRSPAMEGALSPEDLAEKSSDNDVLAAAIAKLPEREGKIVSMHYYKGRAFKEIASELKVSEPRISQLHSRALKMLQGYMKPGDEAPASGQRVSRL